MTFPKKLLEALIFFSLFLFLFRILEQSVYSQHDVVELVSMLVGAPTIEEQADILHYLVLCYGPRYKILAAQVRGNSYITLLIVLICLFVSFLGGAVGSYKVEGASRHFAQPRSVLWPQIQNSRCTGYGRATCRARK